MIEYAEAAKVKFKSGIAPMGIVAEMLIANTTIAVYDKKQIPNRFHRFMQHVILGIKWKVY